MKFPIRKIIFALMLVVNPLFAFAAQTIPFISFESFKANMAINCLSFTHSREVRVNNAVGLTAALSKAIPGDLILLADGTYKGNFKAGSQSGTSTSPISVCGSSNAILDAGGKKNGYVLYLNKVNYWNIGGITITNGQKGIVLDNSNNNRISTVTVSQMGDEGVHFRTNSTHNILENSMVHDTGKRKPGYGEGVYVGSAESNMKNDKSDFNQILNNYIGPKVTAECIDIKEYSSSGLIEGNHFDGSGLSGVNYADSWMDVKGNKYTIRNNIGTNTRLDGFQTHIQVKGWGDYNVFDGNTLNVNAKGYGIRIHLKSADGKNNIVKCNNTVSGAALGLSNVACQR